MPKRDRAEIISSRPWKDLPTSCCEQGLKSDFLLLSIPPLNLFTLSQEVGKVGEAFYNVAGVTEVAGISQVPIPSYSSLPLNMSRDSLSLTIKGILPTASIFTFQKQSPWQNIILTKISKKQMAHNAWTGSKIFGSNSNIQK